MDVDNVRWNTADIFLTTLEDPTFWKENNFRRTIFSKCFLWENFRTVTRGDKREDVVRLKQELMQMEWRPRGYCI